MKTETINQIKEKFKKGLSLKQIAEEFELVISTVRYNLIEKERNYRKQKAREYVKNLSKQKKKEIQIKKREYSKNYFKNRYKNDKQFRDKHIQRVIENHKKRYKTDKKF